MNFLIVWAVSYHIGESDRVGNEVAKAVETGRSRQETRGREQVMVAWSKSGCLRGLLTLILALSAAQASAEPYPELPVNSIGELMSYAKANPGKLSYGVGNSTGHIAGETIKKRTGTDIVRVNYRSNPAVVTDLIAGHIPMAIPDFNTGLPQLKTQKVRALAVLTKERNRVLPDVPTLSETVMPGFDILAWAGMFGPANLPPEIVKVLADAVQKALSTPLVIERLNAGGTEVFWSGPQDFSDFVKTELAKWTAAIKEAGIEPE